MPIVLPQAYRGRVPEVGQAEIKYFPWDSLADEMAMLSALKASMQRLLLRGFHWLLPLPTGAASLRVLRQADVDTTPSFPLAPSCAAAQSGEVQALWMPETFLAYVAASDCTVAVVEDHWIPGMSIELRAPGSVSVCWRVGSVARVVSQAPTWLTVLPAGLRHACSPVNVPAPMCPSGMECVVCMQLLMAASVSAVQFDVAFAFARGFNNTGLQDKMNAAILSLKESRERPWGLELVQGSVGWAGWRQVLKRRSRYSLS